MKYQGFILIALLSTILVGCNDDIGSNRHEVTNAPIVDESVNPISGIFREKGTKVLTYSEEIEVNSTAKDLRPIPDIRFDDDGNDGKNVDTRSSLTRPTTSCGLIASNTLAQKIADCATANKTLATWSGTVHANSGEGIWNLVSLSEISTGLNEVWIDQRTGMLWSDVVDAAADWCKSSGSDLATSDTVGINCAIVGKGQSLCTNYDPAELPKVTWRLPTRSDYLQADVNGSRFVLKQGSNAFWTATTTTDKTLRDSAWTYNMNYGTLISEIMTSTRNVRCIGTPNF